jgi:DinB superfamily
MRPKTTDYPPFYKTYIDKIDGEDVLTLLNSQTANEMAFLQAFPKEKQAFRYAENKWTSKEVLGHITDTERIMAYRALRFARKDATALAGFEEDDYVANAHFNDFSWEELLEEFQAVRAASLSLFKRLTAENLTQSGVANGNPITVNALFFIILGHSCHHLNVLKERYV